MNTPQETSFDLFRLSRSKKIVDIHPDTLRAWESDGLSIYRKGKAAFVSKAELEVFIKSRLAGASKR